VTRLIATASILTILLLSSCSSSEPEIGYEVVDGLAVIESETWTSKQDSSRHAWHEVASSTGDQAAKVSTVPTKDQNTVDFKDSDSTATVDYKIEFREPGLFYIWLRLKTLSTEPATTPSLKLTVPSITRGESSTVMTISDDWHWTAVDENLNTLSKNVSAPGIHTLRITTDSTEILIDKIILTSRPEFTPTGIGPESTQKITMQQNAATDDAPTGNLQTDDPQAEPPLTDGINRHPEVRILFANESGFNTTTVGQSFQLHADATDDGLPTGNLYTFWSKLNGPGDVQFNDQTLANPTVRFSVPGTYSLQVSANDSDLYRNAVTTIEVYEADSEVITTTVNQQPTASISGSNSVSVGQPLHLSSNATDDGLPHGALYHYWSLLDGAGTATFDDNQAQATTVIFNQPGRYVIQLSANDGERYSNATMEINVTAQSSTGSNDESQQSSSLTGRWQTVSARGAPASRHETTGIVVDGKLYLIGGRGHKDIDVYDPSLNEWSHAARPPIEMHHFQAVAVDHVIYVVGASTCCFPVEGNISNVYQFDTRSEQWSQGAAIPANRQRGSTAAAVYNRKIYIVGGNTRGHSGEAVNWFDEFDPATGQWTTLANAPDARDHATVAVVDDQLVVAGGRRSDFPNTFGNTVGRTNIYDLTQKQWQTAANIPTQRAGTMAVSVGKQLVVIGGESPDSVNAHDSVEAFDIGSRSWSSLAPMPTPRHGGAAAVINNTIHVVAGSMQRGGAPETNVHEILR